jgi:hypothetical protein
MFSSRDASRDKTSLTAEAAAEALEEVMATPGSRFSAPPSHTA